jgi:hypothetical protein
VGEGQNQKERMKTTLSKFGVALALAAVLTTAANASVIAYGWVAAPGQGSMTAIGILQWDPTTVSGPLPSTANYTFDVYDNGVLVADDSGVLPSSIIAYSLGYVSPGSIDLALDGAFTPSGGQWVYQVGNVPSSNEDEFILAGGAATLQGDWVDFPAFPEPTTLIAGAMLLLPFGVSTLRTLRRKIAA